MEQTLVNTRGSDMKGFVYIITLIFGVVFAVSCGILSAGENSNGEKIVYNKLTPEEERIIVHKGTEAPFTGELLYNKADGVYTCKRCNAELYRSSDKFDSHCGWPSFDDEIPGAVAKSPDPDGRRTEITCARCGGHLGHVFYGEKMTEKDTRHCVNSLSINFVPAGQEAPVEKSENYERAIFAAGCFWGVEYHAKRAEGVISTKVGYTGGTVPNPTYKEVCTGTTGHAEAVEIVFDPSKTSYETLARLFFETHDFTQVDGQGPDIGPQYRSEIFYLNDEQKDVAEKLIGILSEMGYKVATKVTPAGEFYSAEDYHQDYYDKKNGTPYCHAYKKVFK